MSAPVPALRALVFDAYGTLFDVHTVAALCETLWPGKGEAITRAWRAKQLEYTWQRSLMRRYQDFKRVTEAGLRYACAAAGAPLADDQLRRLMDAYLELSPFPDAREAIAALKQRKLRLAILSNGSPAMLRPLVKNAGLREMFHAVLSVDELEMYKPAPAVYRLAVEKLELPKGAIGFVSSNCWDACGAKSFGFRTFWVNRAGAPLDDLGAAPDHVIATLAELPPLVAAGA
ncbi:MAG TPA: haloacid dehalogenase type II [Burkholderiales bacterium]|nr:haloacid dehalogenase type II [Burkholderiales bacterium]